MSDEIFNVAHDAASGATQAEVTGEQLTAQPEAEAPHAPDPFVTTSGVFAVDVLRGVTLHNTTLNPHKLAADVAEALNAVLEWANVLYDASSKKQPDA